MFGRLRPGQKLRLEGLKEYYGVSISTLREILNRLVDQQRVGPEDRACFLALASRAMRAVLVDYAQARNAGRRNAESTP